MTAFSIFIFEQVIVYTAFVHSYRLGDAESPDEDSGDDLSASSTSGGPHTQHGHSVTMRIYKGGGGDWFVQTCVNVIVFQRSCLGSFLTQGLSCILANKIHCKRKCIKFKF